MKPWIYEAGPVSVTRLQNTRLRPYGCSKKAGQHSTSASYGLMILLAGSILKRKGIFLGNFDGDDKILVIYKDGNYEITGQETSQRFDTDNIELIEKFDPEKIITAVYLDQDKLQYNVKRFKIETTTLNSKFLFIKEGEGNRLLKVTTVAEPLLEMQKRAWISNSQSENKAQQSS